MDDQFYIPKQLARLREIRASIGTLNFHAKVSAKRSDGFPDFAGVIDPLKPVFDHAINVLQGLVSFSHLFTLVGRTKALQLLSMPEVLTHVNSIVETAENIEIDYDRCFDLVREIEDCEYSRETTINDLRSRLDSRRTMIVDSCDALERERYKIHAELYDYQYQYSSPTSKPLQPSKPGGLFAILARFLPSFVGQAGFLSTLSKSKANRMYDDLEAAWVQDPFKLWLGPSRVQQLNNPTGTHPEPNSASPNTTDPRHLSAAVLECCKTAGEIEELGKEFAKWGWGWVDCPNSAGPKITESPDLCALEDKLSFLCDNIIMGLKKSPTTAFNGVIREDTELITHRLEKWKSLSAEKNLIIAIGGDFSQGKSSLLNAFIGEKLLPVAGTTIAMQLPHTHEFIS